MPSKENGQLMLKRHELPDGFQGRVLKGSICDEGAGCMIFFLIVGSEVTG